MNDQQAEGMLDLLWRILNRLELIGAELERHRPPPAEAHPSVQLERAAAALQRAIRGQGA